MRLQPAFSLIGITAILGACAQQPARTTPRPARTLAELMANLPPGGTTTTVVYASIDLSCGNKTYTVKTGTDGGSCSVTSYPGNPGAKTAICTDSGKGSGGANCSEGCSSSEGAGSCSVKTTR